MRKRARVDTELSAKESQPGEDEAEVVSDRGEDCVGGVAFAAFEIAAAEMAVVCLPEINSECTDDAILPGAAWQ